MSLASVVPSIPLKCFGWRTFSMEPGVVVKASNPAFGRQGQGDLSES